MAELQQNIVELVTVLGRLALQLLQFVGSWSLLIAWIAWWLWGVHWKKTWPVLAQGAWAPALLLLVLVALAWSQISQGPSFLSRLVCVSGLAAIALFCGWLQGVFGWAPAEVQLEPPTSDRVTG